MTTMSKSHSRILSNSNKCNYPNFKKLILIKVFHYSQELDKVRNKIKCISRMLKMQKILRQEHENIVKLKGICPDKRIPRGLLFEGHSALQGAIDLF